MNNDVRKFPGLFGWLALLLLGGTGYLAWSLTRTGPDGTGTPPPVEDAEVVCFGRVTTKESVIGLEPTVAGQIVEVFITKEGPVKKGEKILQLDTTPYALKVRQAEAVMEGARVEMDLADDEQKRFATQLESKKKMLEAARAQVTQAQTAVEAIREKMKKQADATPDIRRATEFELRGSEAQRQQLEALEEAERKVVELFERFGLPNAALAKRAAKAKFDSAASYWDEAKKAVEDCTLKAPKDGFILRLNNVAVGASIGPGSPTPFIYFAPAGGLVVRAELEQEYIHRVKEGMRVVVQDESRAESPEWKGKVVSKSRWIAQKRPLFEPGELNDVRTAECVIELDSPGDDLLIGQRMRVRILTRDRP